MEPQKLMLVIGLCIFLFQLLSGLLVLLGFGIHKWLENVNAKKREVKNQEN